MQFTTGCWPQPPTALLLSDSGNAVLLHTCPRGVCVGQCATPLASVHRKWPDVAPDPTVIFEVRSRLATLLELRTAMCGARTQAGSYTGSHIPHGIMFAAVQRPNCPTSHSTRQEVDGRRDKPQKMPLGAEANTWL